MIKKYIYNTYSENAINKIIFIDYLYRSNDFKSGRPKSPMSEKSEATFHMRKHKVTHVRKKQSDIFVKKKKHL